VDSGRVLRRAAIFKVKVYAVQWIQVEFYAAQQYSRSRSTPHSGFKVEFYAVQQHQGQGHRQAVKLRIARRLSEAEAVRRRGLLRHEFAASLRRVARTLRLCMWWEDFWTHPDPHGTWEDSVTEFHREQQREYDELLELESPRSACSTDQQFQREFVWSERYTELESDHLKAFLPAKSSSSSSSFVSSIFVGGSKFFQTLSHHISSVAQTGCPYARSVVAILQYIFDVGKPFARRPIDKDFSFLCLLACLLACLLVCVPRLTRSNVEVVVVVIEVVRC